MAKSWCTVVVILALAGCSPKGKAPAGLAPVQDAGKAVETAAKDPKGTAEDISTTSKVKSAFGLNKVLDGTNINVTTNSGVVTLEGTVSAKKQSDEAERTATHVSGVKQVVNKLKVGAAS